ncbi:MAG TPA: glycosyl hydrolase family 79 C-terminal domain-containing protein [Mucilaginibacter sp.]|nr:glycosyl hydrolase family 79 C-terminal domain-containing protein [Mucilaginibacter sp.]
MNKLLPLLLLAALLASCRKEDPNRKLFIYNSNTVNVTISSNHAGNVIPETFEGLSFENSLLGEDISFLNADNKVLVQLLRNLGPGIIRMGGATSDFVTWSAVPRDAATPLNTITPTDIDRLSALSNAAGWPVMFGLNLGENDARKAAVEAAYIRQRMGANLYAFQFGNEPDAYGPYEHLRYAGYSPADFMAEWENYRQVVGTAVPDASFAGPDIASNNSWIQAFAGREYSRVKLLDGHYYETGPATSPAITYNSILSYNGKLSSLIQSFKAAPGMQQLPFRVTECNNVYGGGKQGVSDVFASALWALDTMWILADNGCQGINFHNGLRLHYSPIFSENGVLTARPEYYAMLAFKYGSSGGRTVAAQVDQGQYCSAHACLINDICSVTLINKSIDKDFDFNVIPTRRVSAVNIQRLTAPSITALTGVKFSGSSVSADGRFNPGDAEYAPVNKNSFIVHVPAASAAVVFAR